MAFQFPQDLLKIQIGQQRKSQLKRASDFFFLGDRARYPFKFRTVVLITTTIVVAVLRKMKTQSTSTTAFSRNRPYP